MDDYRNNPNNENNENNENNAVNDNRRETPATPHENNESFQTATPSGSDSLGDTREISLEGLGAYPSYASTQGITEEESEAGMQFHAKAEDFDRPYTPEPESVSKTDVQRIVKKAIHEAKPRFIALKAMSLILIGAILGSWIGPTLGARWQPKTAEIPTTGAQQTVHIAPSKEVTTEKAVATKARPSVVGITTSVASPGNFLNNEGGIARGVGSGVIVSSDGYILTNSHVVSDGQATDIKVLLDDGQETPATIVWNDQTLDLAVLKVEKTGLPAIELGSSSEISVGDKAIAIGNPLGLELQSTLTSGYISGLNRTITFENGLQMEGLMQTDAAINRGNSGGALLDAQGRLIGINTAKNSAGEGIGFAIPIDTAKPIIEAVLRDGTFTTPIIGFSGLDYSLFKRANGIDHGPDAGAIVMKVVDNAQAAQVLEPYDIIVGIDGVSVDTMGALKKELLGKKPGQEVTLKIIRDAKEMEVTTTLIGRDRQE